MFILRTGLQGNGKTLNTIKEVDEKARKENRAVYFHNLTGLKPEKLKATWIEFDAPEKWFDLPNDAIIVIDEAQQFFRVRAQGTKVPEYASRLEIMRKQGHELHCITQHPDLIDVHFRKLCNKHIHYNRLFGSKKVARWEFERPAAIDRKSSFADGQKTVIDLDKKYFDVYTSTAAGHHFKFRPPKALFVLVGCLVLLVLGGWRLYQSRIASDAPVDLASVAAPGAAPSAAPGLPMESGRQVVTREQYLRDRTPRVADLPSSAPLYDELTQAVTYPKLVCAATADPALIDRKRKSIQIGFRDGQTYGCRCNSQQGTRLQVSFDMCMDVVENGHFDPARPDSDSKKALAGGAGRSAPATPAIAAARPASSAARVEAPDHSAPGVYVSAFAQRQAAMD